MSDHYVVTRKTGDIEVAISWPMTVANPDWYSLPVEVCNEVRDHLDAAADAVVRYREARGR